MGKLEEALKSLIKQQYGGVPNFAEKAGLPVSTVYNALNRGMANTRTETSYYMYELLNLDKESVSLTDFHELKEKGARGERPYSRTEVPIYSCITADTPIRAHVCEETFPVPSEIKAKYPQSGFLRVNDDGYNRRLPAGYLALVDFNDTEPNGHDPYAVCVNGFAATIQRVKKLAHGFELIPCSYDPTRMATVYDYNKPGTEEITIIGKVVWATMPLGYEI